MMRSNDLLDSSQLGSSEPAAAVQTNWIKPVLGNIFITFYMNAQWLVPVSRA